MRPTLRRAVAITVVAGFLAVLAWKIGQPPEEGGPQYTVERNISYSFTLQNTSNQLLEHADLWVHGPVKQTSWQRSVGISASHEYRLQVDEHGNQLLHFEFDNLAPFAAKVVTVRAKLLLAEQPVPLGLSDPQRFLRSTTFMPTGNEQLRSLAASLSAPTALESMRSAYTWTNKNIKYAGYIRDDRGALYALNKREGDCTEYMYLFGALARLQGVPMRGMGGFVYGEDSVLRPEAYHNWAEVYVGGAWRVVDAQNERFMEQESHYIAMRVLADNKKSDQRDNTHRFVYGSGPVLITMN